MSEKVSGRQLVHIIILAVLFLSTLVGLLFSTVDDFEYIDSLSSYKLPADYSLKYKIFDYEQFETLTHKLRNTEIDDSHWQSTGIPSFDFQTLDLSSPKWITYRFHFPNPPVDQQWAFAPIILSHTQYWAYQGKREIEAIDSWQNNKRIIILPVTQPDSKNSSEIIVSIVAKLDRNSYGLGSIFGYFYGPYQKFPRIFYQVLNIGHYSLLVFIIGSFLTLILILMVLLLPSHKEKYQYLVLYSLFFNVLSVLPYVFFHLEYAKTIFLLISLFQGAGLVSLGLYFIDYFSSSSKKYWIAYFGLYFSIYVLLQVFWQVADTYMMQARVFMLLSLALLGISKWKKRKKITEEQRFQYQITIILIACLAALDTLESLFFHNPFINRFQTFHLMFFSGFLVLSIRQMRKREFENIRLKETESKFEFIKRSFQILDHDIMHPFNKVQLQLANIVKKEGLENKKDFLAAIMAINKDLKQERRYITSMVANAKQSFSELEPVLNSVDIAEIVSEQNVSVFSSATDKTKFIVKVDSAIVRTDESLLLRVLRNLVKNAIHATSGSTKITLSSVVKRRFILIRVHNTNSRIPDSIVKKLFDPYVSTRRKSLGLGLFISKTIIEKLNGQIEVRNEESGVCFEILLRR